MARTIPAPPGGANAFGSNNNNTVTQSGNASTNGVTNTTTNQQQVSSGVSNTTGSSSSRDVINIDYLDPVARKALNDLIGQLSAGGTPEQRAQMEQRLNEIVKNQGLRDQYSQANAFAQAEGAANSQLAKSLQATLPQIAASVDAAGTSGSAFSALLTQQAAADAAGIAAEQGLQASVAYGQIQAGLSGVLEQLTRAEQDPVISSLIQALNIAKGSVETGTKTSTGSSSSNTTSSEVSNMTGNQQQTTSGKTTDNSTTVTKPNKNTTTTTGFSGFNTPSANRSTLNANTQLSAGKKIGNSLSFSQWN